MERVKDSDNCTAAESSGPALQSRPPSSGVCTANAGRVLSVALSVKHLEGRMCAGPHCVPGPNTRLGTGATQNESQGSQTSGRQG